MAISVRSNPLAVRSISFRYGRSPRRNRRRSTQINSPVPTQSKIPAAASLFLCKRGEDVGDLAHRSSWSHETAAGPLAPGRARRWPRSRMPAHGSSSGGAWSCWCRERVATSQGAWREMPALSVSRVGGWRRSDLAGSDGWPAQRPRGHRRMAGAATSRASADGRCGDHMELATLVRPAGVAR